MTGLQSTYHVLCDPAAYAESSAPGPETFCYKQSIGILTSQHDFSVLHCHLFALNLHLSALMQIAPVPPVLVDLCNIGTILKAMNLLPNYLKG